MDVKAIWTSPKLIALVRAVDSEKSKFQHTVESQTVGHTFGMS
jgi:hypothetical protein